MTASRCATKLLAVCGVLLTACGGGGGGSGGAPVQVPPDAFTDPVSYSGAPGAALSGVQETSVATRHSLVIGGKTISYTATAGHLIAADMVSHQPEASFFYVAYTGDGADPAQRPVTFFYNGGPGSATIWLHLGSFGPKRLVSGDPSASPTVPFPLVDNPDSLLDVSDLVFVDAVGAGLSEAIAPNTNRSFWGVDADAAVFRDFVLRYIAATGREASPRFLFGESYGTTRSAVLANELETAGVGLKGVVLQSSVLNYNSNCAVLDPNTVNCAGYMPSYAMVGAWYQLDQTAPSDLVAYAQQMRDYASNSYGPAADAYIQSGTPLSSDMASQLSGYTGASPALWSAHPDMDPGTFESGLIANTVLGGYDARVHVARNSAIAQAGDPSSVVIHQPFVDALRNYLPQFLHYSSASTYIVGSDPAINDWDFSHDGKALPDVIPDLASALAQNPGLMILSLNGYHDLVTPFYQTQLDLARLGTQPKLRFGFYAGGHMTYLDDGSRPLEKADLAAFYAAALVP
jgi:carboxypeptidase C (cathepsin A)